MLVNVNSLLSRAWTIGATGLHGGSGTTTNGEAMYGMLITFRTSIPLDQLGEPFGEYAQALRTIPGLVSKAWLHDDDTVGGFHLFEDEPSAQAYLTSELATGLRANEAFDDFEVRGFEVLDELSAVTGVVTAAPLAAS